MTIKNGSLETFEEQIKTTSLLIVITPELDPFCVQFFLHELEMLSTFGSCGMGKPPAPS